MDLEVAGTDRRLDTVAVTSCVGESLGDRRLARAVEPEHSAVGLRRLCQHPPERLGCDGSRPQTPQLPRWAGQHDDDASAGVQNDAGRRARKTERDRPLGQSCLLENAVREIRIGAAHTLGEAPRDLLDLAREGGVDAEGPPRDASDELDRPIVMGRSEAARDEADVRLERLAQRGLELIGIVTDDRDPRRLQAEETVPLGHRTARSDPFAPRAPARCR